MDPVEQASGVSQAEALQIDKINLFEKLGEETFKKISENFYTRVFNDEEKWFRNIFKNVNFEDAVLNQMDFFIQRMGGPARFSKRKGHPALMGRHMNFNMSEKSAKRWLYHMQNTLDEMPEIDEDSKTRMMNFFCHTAFFLSLGVSRQQRNR